MSVYLVDISSVLCALFLLFRTKVDARIVPAKTDICNRYPGFSVLCINGKSPPLPSVPETPSAPEVPPVPEVPLPPTPPPIPTESGLNRTRYCAKYGDHFEFFCGSPSDRAKNPQAADFCSSFESICPEANINEEEIVKRCLEKAPLARQFCDGREPAKFRTQCSLWYRYCANNPKVNPTAINDPYVAGICRSYQYMGDVYCPGYESIVLRQYCNYYRVYCQGKKAFPNIDGNVGIVLNNWGVGGIPFYPFNPQGAIAGGERIDVGFGDWGADYNIRRGITDYYEQSDQFAANWQRGNFGGGTSWNVPLVGIGGYNRNGVSLGGLANFADLPGLFSGGVPLGPPLSGLGQIPLSQGLPVPQAAGLGVNSLATPIGTGNLGILGALLSGEPVSAGAIGPVAQFGGLGRKKRDVRYKTHRRLNHLTNVIFIRKAS